MLGRHALLSSRIVEGGLTLDLEQRGTAFSGNVEVAIRAAGRARDAAVSARAATSGREEREGKQQPEAQAHQHGISCQLKVKVPSLTSLPRAAEERRARRAPTS